MTRVLKNSRVNPRKIDEDTAYNKAVNRGEDTAQSLKVTQIADQPKKRYPNRARRNSPS